MNTNNRKKPPLLFFLTALITANVGIVISIMHIVFHFIDSVNYSVAFLDNDVTYVLMIVLSACTMIASVCVLMMLDREKNKSYFFRKVAFIAFWLCFLNILFQRNVIMPNMLKSYQRNMIWFFVSTFSIFNAVFCNGLLCTKPREEMESPIEADVEAPIEAKADFEAPIEAKADVEAQSDADDK